jgi:predicted acyltransferase
VTNRAADVASRRDGITHIPPAPRVEFLDQFRGFTVSLMILVNILSSFEIVPAWMKHATAMGRVTVPDFVIPTFLFIIGVAFELSFSRSLAAHGAGRTVWRFTRRSLLLIAFGILGSLLLKHDVVREWGVLETLGAAGLVALPFMFTRPRWRPVFAVLLVALYELISRLGLRAWLVVNDSGHLGGIPGGLTWAGVVLLGSLAGSFVRNRDVHGLRVYCAAIGLAGIGAGLLLGRWLPVYKPPVTATYLLLTTGTAAALLLVFSLLNLRFPLFKVFGVNALAIFMLHGIVLVTMMERVPVTGSLPVVVLVLVGVYGLCGLVAALLYRFRVFIRL